MKAEYHANWTDPRVFNIKVTWDNGRAFGYTQWMCLDDLKFLPHARTVLATELKKLAVVLEISEAELVELATEALKEVAARLKVEEILANGLNGAMARLATDIWHDRIPKTPQENEQ